MRVLVDIGHPGHVHFYKHVIRRLEAEGHKVLISARDKDVTLELLDLYDLPYQTLSAIGAGLPGLAREFLQREWSLARLIGSFQPDVITEIGGLFIAPICKLMGKPSVVFTDTEHVAIDRYLTYPFSSVICTPQSFKRNLGRRHLRYPGFHELAYLHPNHFELDPAILNKLGVAIDEPYSVLRFVAWTASHDVGQEGFSASFKHKLVRKLSQYGKVFITSEGDLPAKFEAYRIKIPSNEIHHVLAYAQLYLGEGATMATEAGILGTPSIYMSSLVGTMGNFDELMTDYKLVYSYQNSEEALQKAVSILEQNNAKSEWQKRRQQLLADKIDVAQFVYEMLHRYGSLDQVN